MPTSPIRCAQLVLLAGLALVVLMASLPNPQPSTAWLAAATTRYGQRFGTSTLIIPAAQIAKKRESRESHGKTDARQARPIRTAQLPLRAENGRAQSVEMPKREPLRQDARIEKSAQNRVLDPVQLQPLKRTAVNSGSP